jgi:hypothetical protein
MRRLYLDHVSASRLAARGAELCGAINSATKRGRRDGDERRPRHRLFWAGGLKEVGDHYILALPCPCQNKGAAACCLTATATDCCSAGSYGSHSAHI